MDAGVKNLGLFIVSGSILNVMPGPDTSLAIEPS